MPLDLTQRRDGDIAIITVDGELDTYESWQFRELALDVANRQECRWIVLDLDRCDFLDSTGLATIVGALRRARAVNGNLAVACTREPISRIFRITGLVKILPMHATAEDAVAALRAQQVTANA